jgi:hypothetical protein
MFFGKVWSIEKVEKIITVTVEKFRITTADVSTPENRHTTIRLTTDQDSLEDVDIIFSIPSSGAPFKVNFSESRASSGTIANSKRLELSSMSRLITAAIPSGVETSFVVMENANVMEVLMSL